MSDSRSSSGVETPGPKRELVVFLHGLGQTPQAWQDQVVALPSGIGAVAPWLYGLKPGSQDLFELSRAADDVARTLDLQGIQRAHLVGVSLGARVALESARRHGDRVETLVLGGMPGTPPLIARGVSRLATRLVPRATYANQQLDKSRVVAATDAVARMGAATGKGVEQRSLLLVGSQDAAGRGVARQLQEEMPNAVLQELTGAGHLVNTEAAQGFTQALLDFHGWNRN